MSERKARDRILIKDLLLRGVIGANDWERKAPQDILVNISIDCDARAAAKTDDLSQAMDYRAVTKSILAHVEHSQPRLVEALAEQIARICLVQHGAVRVVVRVEKPGAVRFARSVGVEIERDHSDVM